MDRYICHNWKNLRLISPSENRIKNSRVDKALIYLFSVLADVFLEGNKDHIIMNLTLYDWVD